MYAEEYSDVMDQSVEEERRLAEEEESRVAEEQAAAEAVAAAEAAEAATAEAAANPPAETAAETVSESTTVDANSELGSVSVESPAEGGAEPTSDDKPD